MLVSMLTAALLAAGCGQITAPTPELPPADWTASPTLAPSAAPTEAPRVVRPGAYCSPAGTAGTTVDGVRMRCTPRRGEHRPRWRQVRK